MNSKSFNYIYLAFKLKHSVWRFEVISCIEDTNKNKPGYYNTADKNGNQIKSSFRLWISPTNGFVVIFFCFTVEILFGVYIYQFKSSNNQIDCEQQGILFVLHFSQLFLSNVFKCTNKHNTNETQSNVTTKLFIPPKSTQFSRVSWNARDFYLDIQIQNPIFLVYISIIINFLTLRRAKHFSYRTSTAHWMVCIYRQTVHVEPLTAQ